jgi:hypothetical protein
MAWVLCLEVLGRVLALFSFALFIIFNSPSKPLFPKDLSFSTK